MNTGYKYPDYLPVFVPDQLVEILDDMGHDTITRARIMDIRRDAHGAPTGSYTVALLAPYSGCSIFPAARMRAAPQEDRGLKWKRNRVAKT